jgi:porin
LTWTGLFDSRPTDKLGVAVGVIHVTTAGQQLIKAVGIGGGFEYETSLELTYRAVLSDWLTVQPDIQYIINPGLVSPVNGKVKDAFVFGLHFEMGHLFNL